MDKDKKDSFYLLMFFYMEEKATKSIKTKGNKMLSEKKVRAGTDYKLSQ